MSGPGVKFFMAGAYLQTGWRAFADTGTTLLPVHDVSALPDTAFSCIMGATVNAGELVAVDLPRYDQPVPDLSGGIGRPATEEERLRLQELQATEEG